MRWKAIRLMAAAGLAAGAIAIAPGSAGAVSFSNTNAISPVDGMQAGAPVTVSGQAGTVSKVRVTLVNLGHNTPDDLDILLVGPGGQRGMVLSDTCGAMSMVNATMFLEDSAGGTAPSLCGPGATYKPTDEAPADAFVAPAPTTGPYPATFAGFIGADPNGTWTLFAVDDNVNGQLTFIANGWTLDLDIAPPPAVVTPTAAAPAAPAAVTTAAKKCKKGRKLKRGKCVKKTKK